MNFLYDLIYMIPVSLLSVLLGGTYVGIPKNSILACIICVACSTWVVMLRHSNQKKRLRRIGIVFVFFAGLMVVLGDANRHLLIEKYGFTGWAFLFALFSIVFGLILEKCRWIRLVTAVALFSGAIVVMVKQWEVGKLSFSLLTFMFLTFLSEEIQRKWKKSGYADFKSHVVMTSPVLMILCAIVLVIPSSSKPYDWQIVKTIYNRIAVCANQISGMLRYRTEEYGNAGFSDGADFFGKISKNEKEVLHISFDRNKVKDIQLIGNISGDFQGDGWVFETDEESNNRIMDTLETTCAVKKYDSDQYFEYIRKVNVNYENLFHNTRYIFAPPKMQYNFLTAGNPEYMERNNSLFAKKRMKYGDTYSFFCYTLNYDNPQMFDLLNCAEQIEEKEWNQNAKYEGLLSQQEFSYQNYRSYQKSIYDKYCATDGVSEEVSLILDEIRQNSGNKYEAMKNLETYLKAFEYTTEPGKIPKSVVDGKTYLDYFLLDSQKGYCVHYATAFVLMARELGLPSRYVQGYYVQSGKTNDVVVTQSDAHSWPEVYFDHVGWIAFEPTPGYSIPRGWKNRSQVSNNAAYGEEQFHAERTDREENGEMQSADSGERKEKVLAYLKMLALPLVGVLGFLILFMCISRIVTKAKYRHLSNEEKLRYLTAENLRLLKLMGYPMECGETLNEYRHRVDTFVNEENLIFISYYEELIYSDRKADESQIRRAEQIYQILKQQLRKKKWRYRFISFMF